MRTLSESVRRNRNRFRYRGIKLAVLRKYALDGPNERVDRILARLSERIAANV